MVFKWNDQHTLLFLEHFKNYQCLWNHRLDGYKDRTIRARSIKSLISDLNLDVTEWDIKLKIKTIRTRYATELTKINQSKSGSSSEVYVPTLYWFKHAEFLSSVCVPRNRTSNIEPVKIYTQEKTLDEDPEESDEQSHSQGSPEQDTPNVFAFKSTGLTPMTTMTPKTPMTPMTRKRRKEPPTHTYSPIKEFRTIREPKEHVNPIEPIENEFDLFCKSLAIQLKKMPLDRALICQEKLQSVMTQERLAQVEQASPLVKLENQYDSDSSS